MRPAFFLILASCMYANPVQSADIEHLSHQGVERQYRLHNKDAAANGPAPLIVHLHGFRGREKAEEGRNTLDYIAWGELEPVADSGGFVVVQPAAYWGQWSLFPGLKNTTLEDGTEIDDVRFIFDVVDHLVTTGIANSQQIYLSGISDGAIMTYRLLCESGSPFAAAVSIVGTMYENHLQNCSPEYPTPIMVIAGTNDRILPYDGWLFPTGREVSIPETMEHWRLLHGCDGQEMELLDDRNPDDNSRVASIIWTNCSQEGAVRLLRAEGGGHAVPGFTPVSESWRDRGGGHNRDIESADEVWKFVQQFSRVE